MIMRRQFTQTETQEKLLADEAEQLRKLARGTPPGVERDRLWSVIGCSGAPDNAKPILA